MKISIIAAVSENGTIGKKGKIPWYISDDLRHFKKITMGHHILMGRKTYNSIGKALPGRTSLIITGNKNFKAPDCLTFESVGNAVKFAEKRNENELFIVGGGEIYKAAMPIADKIYLTRIYKKIDGDIVFPSIKKDSWKETLKENHLENDPPYGFIELVKK